MNPYAFAALWTLALVAVAAFFEVNELPLSMPLILFSAGWAYRDAERLEAERYEGWMARSSIRIALWIGLLWIVAFPAYLLLRQRIVLGQATVKPDLSLGGRPMPPPRPPTPAVVRPERAAKLNRFAAGCAVLALIGIAFGLALPHLSPGSRAEDIIVLSAMPAALGIALALWSLRDGGAGFRLAASALLAPVLLLLALTVGMEFVSQPVRQLVLEGTPLPPEDLFPERAGDLRRTSAHSQWFNHRGCYTYAAIYQDEASGYAEISAELCPTEAVVAAAFEAHVAAWRAESSTEALRHSQANRAEIASRTCPANPCQVRVLRQAGTRLFELSGAEDATLRLDRGLWPPSVGD